MKLSKVYLDSITFKELQAGEQLPSWASMPGAFNKPFVELNFYTNEY